MKSLGWFLLLIATIIAVGYAFYYIDRWEKEDAEKNVQTFKTKTEEFEVELKKWQKVTADPCSGPFEKELWPPQSGRTIVRFGREMGAYDSPQADKLRLTIKKESVEVYFIDNLGQREIIGEKYNADSQFCRNLAKK